MTVETNINRECEIDGRKVRWIENPAALGWRFIGYADTINDRIDHKGWHLDQDFPGDELARGIVYKIGGNKRGQVCFGYGIADPCNDGPALLAFSRHDTDDAETVAKWADQFAERYAEHESQYQAESNARIRHDDLAARLDDCRVMLRELIADARASAMRPACVRHGLPDDPPRACGNGQHTD